MNDIKTHTITIVADTHVHFYPCYDLDRAFRTLRSNLLTRGNDCLSMAFLAERYDCHFFKNFKEHGIGRAGSQDSIKNYGEALLIKEQGGQEFYLFAGRQVITAERLEILALTTDMAIPDGLPVREVIQRVNQEGGVAVISWAPGKWFGKRGEIVRHLMSEFSPDKLLIGDTTLRPWCWLEPVLMRKGRKSGFKILAGSDPLPFPGEEKVMGKYVSTWKMQFDAENPVDSVRNYLKKSRVSPEGKGRRGLCFETLKRLYSNQKSK